LCIEQLVPGQCPYRAPVSRNKRAIDFRNAALPASFNSLTTEEYQMIVSNLAQVAKATFTLNPISMANSSTVCSAEPRPMFSIESNSVVCVLK